MMCERTSRMSPYEEIHCPFMPNLRSRITLPFINITYTEISLNVSSLEVVLPCGKSEFYRPSSLPSEEQDYGNYR
ncbi:hypothetical protein TNCV_1806201 [Trichonephila clavipes]|nr:hypothetical protein TNCV_1806201 [Trichonephila clavipes]